MYRHDRQWTKPPCFNKVLLLSILVSLSGCDREPDRSRIIVVVPEDPQFQNFLAWQARGPLAHEVVHNLYDGIFNPAVPQGYGDGMAADFRQDPTSGTSRPELHIQLKYQRKWIHPQTGPDRQVTAQDIVDAWSYVVRTPTFPQRSRYTSVIENIEKSSENNLIVTFKMPIDLSKRAREALSFRLFPTPVGGSSPIGSGPFVLSYPQSVSQRQRELLPSGENFPAGGTSRPVIEIQPLPSSRSRLKEVLDNRAQVALSIPPYYLQERGGSSYQLSDRYNVWALVFSTSLSQPQRRYLAATLDAEQALGAFLNNISPTVWGSSTGRLISPTVYPATFEIFECMDTKLKQNRLGELPDVAERLLNRQNDFNLKSSGEVGNFPDPLRIAYLDEGPYAEGAPRIAEDLKSQIESDRMFSGVRATGLKDSEWRQAMKDLPSGQGYHAVLVRFEYDRRCDISRHFRADPDPGPQGGLFRWTGLAWDSGDLKDMQELGYCDLAVEPTLRLVQLLHDIAPAKFLFTVPNLVVHDPKVSLEVNDEYVLAGSKDWRWIQ